MKSKQKVMNMINKLSEDQLRKLVEYIRLMFFQKERGDKAKLNDEQRGLLELLHYSIETGRGDFAERHDYYLYGKPK